MTIGFVFPGQGAQTVGMLADVSALDANFKPRLEEASDAVGFDLAGLISDGPDERLNQTEVTQPAVLAVSVALYEVWIGQNGRTPDFLAGHSFGSGLNCKTHQIRTHCPDGFRRQLVPDAVKPVVPMKLKIIIY